MPYIKPEYRPVYDSIIADLADQIVQVEDPLKRVGVANYVITTLLLKIFPERQYGTMALVDGLITGIGREYYRRRTVPYEDEKIAENGDVY